MTIPRAAGAARFVLVLTLALFLPVGCAAEKDGNGDKDQKKDKKQKGGKDEKGKKEKAAAPGAGGVSFEPLPKSGDRGTLNASGAVALGDSRFLFCDNQTPGALFELDLSGGQAKVTRRPLTGVSASGVDDIEAMTVARENGRPVVFAVTSLGMSGKGGGARPGGLMRLTEGAGGALRAEMISGFREWLVARSPLVAAAAGLDPDAGGLNIEGLAWDPARRALLVGLRTPLERGRPVLLPVRVASLTGPWTGADFELLPPIVLDPGGGAGNLGVRSVEYDEARKAFLVVLGRATSGTEVPFELFVWDGNAEGRMAKAEGIVFPARSKPEGIAAGTVGGSDVVVVFDDAGGYAVLPDETMP